MTSYFAALALHITDLREGTHGGRASREEKERLFAAAVPLLDPYARQALTELNAALLGGGGRVDATGLTSEFGAGVAARWILSWPEQRALGSDPVIIHAHYGRGFHHPHLRGGTVAEWPLNVFDEDQAATELPTLRAIAAADLHNLVFQHTHRLVPVLSPPAG